MDNNIRNLRHVTNLCGNLYLCFQLAFSAQAQSPIPRNAAPSNCNTQHNLSHLCHLYNSFSLHNGMRLLLCADSTALSLSEGNPSETEKKKKTLGRVSIKGLESSYFPACTAIFGIRFLANEPRLVFTWMREITWMPLLTARTSFIPLKFINNLTVLACVHYKIQGQSHSKLTITL